MTDNYLILTFTETRIFCPGFKPLMLINASDLGAFAATGGATGLGAFLEMVLATFSAKVAAFTATIERAAAFSHFHYCHQCHHESRAQLPLVRLASQN